MERPSSRLHWIWWSIPHEETVLAQMISGRSFGGWGGERNNDCVIHQRYQRKCHYFISQTHRAVMATGGFAFLKKPKKLSEACRNCKWDTNSSNNVTIVQRSLHWFIYIYIYTRRSNSNKHDWKAFVLESREALRTIIYNVPSLAEWSRLLKTLTRNCVKTASRYAWMKLNKQALWVCREIGPRFPWPSALTTREHSLAMAMHLTCALLPASNSLKGFHLGLEHMPSFTKSTSNDNCF